MKHALFFTLVRVAGEWTQVGKTHETARDALEHLAEHWPGALARDTHIGRISPQGERCPTCQKHQSSTQRECYHCYGTGWL
jgi:hypothetical protein